MKKHLSCFLIVALTLTLVSPTLLFAQEEGSSEIMPSETATETITETPVTEDPAVVPTTEEAITLPMPEIVEQIVEAAEAVVNPPVTEPAVDVSSKVLRTDILAGVSATATASATTTSSEGGSGSKSFSADPKTFLDSFQGKHEVSLFSGSLNYSYPLWTPAGRNGMTPQMNLTYSNVDWRYNSPVGYGWSLPINGIYRIQKKGMDTLYTNDSFNADIFGNTEELIVIDAVNNVYAPKNESSFSEYTFNGTSWTAKDKKGTVYRFGQIAGTRQDDPDDSSRVYKWALDSVEDLNGNFMTLTYIKDNGAIYPNTIRYTGFGSEAGLFELAFTYTSRPSYTSYNTGFKVEYNKVVDKIDVISYQTGSPVIKLTYDLSYSEYSDAIQLLTGITVKAGAESLPPTSFTYFNGSETAQYKKINGLYKITEPYGGTYEFSYMPASFYQTPDGKPANKLPFFLYTIHELKSQASASAPVYTTTYDYEDGHYYFDAAHPFLREYAGFGKVKVTDPVGNVHKLYFHQSETDPNNTEDALNGEYQDHISKKGKVYRDEQYDSAENLRKAVIQKWNRITLPDADPEDERNFVALERETVTEYGENSQPKTSARAYLYDAYGNPTQVYDYGEVTLTAQDGSFTDTGTDKITVDTTYAINATSHILGYPSMNEKKDQSGAVIGREKKYYDTLALGEVQKGNLTKTETYKDSRTFVTTQNAYNTRSMVTGTTNPRNYSTTIGYDTNFLYPASVTNAKSQITNYEYDLAFGTPTKVTDPNGGISESVLDGFGRVTAQKVKGTDGLMKTVKTVSYNFTASPVYIEETAIPGTNDTLGSPIQVTKRTYFDGLNRPIQVKTEAEGTNNFIVTSMTYDERGNVKEEYLPKTSATLNFEAIVTSDPKTAYTYDALGRAKTATNSLGTTTTVYNNGWTKVTDANGKIKDYYADARGNLVTVKEYLSGTPYSTVYTYDANNNLTRITDAESKLQNMTYNWLGQKLTEELLHASGATPRSYTYTYDANGNTLTQKDAKNQTLTYTYDQLDRPLTENATEVTYVYDTGANSIGRLTSVTSAGVTKAYEYNILGQTTKEKKTIASVQYDTSFAYDLLGSPVSMTYPDSTVVTYGYNNAGQLEAMPNYVTDFDYSPTGAVSEIHYQNGTVTSNTYDPAKLYRLTHKVTTALAAGTSAPTTATFYPQAGDGSIFKTGTTWADAHDATTGTTVSATATTLYVDTAKESSTTLRVSRGFIPFNTASLPDNATITDAKLKVYVSSKTDNDNDGDDFVTVVQSTQPSTTTLTTADYDLAGAVHSPVEGIATTERKDITNVTTGAYLTFTLNATGQSWISKTSNTKLALREGHDVKDTAFAGTTGQYNRLAIRASEYSGTSSDPKLEVTYTIPGAPTPIDAQDISYAFDPVENITGITDASDTHASKTAVYGYDDLHRITSATITNTGNGQNYSQVYAYSPTGNITTKSDVGAYYYTDTHPHAVTAAGTKTYTYDANGSLLTDGTWTNTYDTRNRLTSSAKTGQTLTYTYDEGRTRVTKTSGTNPVTYISDYYEKEGTVFTKHIFAGGLKIASIKGATVAYSHPDHLSGSNVSTASDGTVLELNDYTPYGSSRIEERATGYTNDYLFTGQERDEETSLYYYGARYYDPSLGRFTSVDPWSGDITDPQSLNKYAYTRNNPLKYVDPTGNFLQFALAAFIPSAVQAVEALMVATMAYIEVKHLQDPVTVPNYGSSEKSLGTVSNPVNTQQKAEPLYTPVNQDTGLNILTNPVSSQSKQTVLPTPAYQDTGGGVCGVNMSCAVEEKRNIPIYGTPNATELKWKNGTIDQSRTRDAQGNPVKDIDFSDHNQPDAHSNPHEHKWTPKEDGTYDVNSRSNPINQ
jgi:RHS repeat-associated protein